MKFSALFQETDYRVVLRKLLENRKKTDKQLTYQWVAEKIRVDRTILSRVLNGHLHLQLDHLFTLTELLQLDSLTSEYLELLWHWDNTSLARRKEVLKGRIEEFRSTHLRTESHLPNANSLAGDEGARVYYSNPAIQVVHVCLGIPCYATDIEKLAHDTGLALSAVKRAVSWLCEHGFAQYVPESSRFEVYHRSIHLPADTDVYEAWYQKIRLAGMQRFLCSSTDSRYGFTTIIGTDEQTRELLLKKFLEFLTEAQELVKDSEAEEVLQMNFDLFSWQD